MFIDPIYHFCLQNCSDGKESAKIDRENENEDR
jgi:uncharacterized protein YuzB (UPF0349 family)